MRRSPHLSEHARCRCLRCERWTFPSRACGWRRCLPRCRSASTWGSVSRWSTCCGSAASRCGCAICSRLTTTRERPPTTARCWSTSAATPTPTSRCSGSVMTSRSRPGSMRTRRTSSPRSPGCCGCSAPGPRRCIACGVGLAFALGGHRVVEAMIVQHARRARSLGDGARARTTGARRARGVL